MTNLETELDRLLDAHDAKRTRAAARKNIGRGVFAARRETAEPTASKLKKRRLRFRGEGLTVAALSERALVSETTIKDLEKGKPGNSLTWLRLAQALNEPPEPLRRTLEIINPNFVR